MHAARIPISVAHSQALALVAAFVAMVLVAGGLPHWSPGALGPSEVYLAP